MTGQPAAAQPALSIVIPVYNGAATIGVLVAALSDLEIIGEHEIILVDDGSRDDSAAVCERLVRSAARVPTTLVRLSRNFGEHNAVMAGLGVARGGHIITMDDDLQNPPSEVRKLFDYARGSGFDIVYTAYEQKQHGILRNLGSQFANWTARLLLDLPDRLYLSSFRCMTSFVAEQVCRYSGPFPYVDGLILQVTQHVGQLQVVHAQREAGQSNYTLRRLIRLWLSICLNFSSIPLRLSAMIGLGASLLSLLMLVIVLLEYFSLGVPVIGWTSLMATILFFSGVQLILLGVLGEYVGRSFQTINRRPQYIARTIVRSEGAQSDLS